MQHNASDIRDLNMARTPGNFSDKIHTMETLLQNEKGLLHTLQSKSFPYFKDSELFYFR